MDLQTFVALDSISVALMLWAIAFGFWAYMKYKK